MYNCRILLLRQVELQENSTAHTFSLLQNFPVYPNNPVPAALCEPLDFVEPRSDVQILMNQIFVPQLRVEGTSRLARHSRKIIKPERANI
jgi:hypothetical protein